MRIEPERGRRDGEPFLLSIETAIAEIFPPEKAPKLRTVREHMERHGCVIRHGRSCYTTRELLEKFKGLVTSCEAFAPSSKRYAARKRTGRSTGRRVGASQSARPMAILPESELSMALAATRQQRAKSRLTG